MRAKMLSRAEELEQEDGEITTDGPNKPYFRPTEIPEPLEGCHTSRELPNLTISYKPTALGYATITRLFAINRQPRTIAHVLGIPFKAFEGWLTGDELAKDARDFGIACLMDRLTDRLLKSSDSNNMISLIFHWKLLGVNPDKDPPKVTNNFFHLTLNDSMTPEQYMASLKSAPAQPQVQASILTEGASVPQTPSVPQLVEHQFADSPPDWLKDSLAEPQAVERTTDSKLLPKTKPTQPEDSIR